MTEARLMKSDDDRMISGVCGGIAAYLGVDSVFVRLAFILLALASGVGFLLYIILMIIMPRENNLNDAPSDVAQENISQIGNDVSSGFKRVRQHRQGPAIAAGLLILLGVYLLLSNFGLLSWLSGGVFWSLLLIGAGIYLIARRRRE
jgi:phage shock protein PspC (stress-responsive transcriptional regulator)